MSKKLIGIMVVVILLCVLGYVKIIYPSSQTQIKMAIKDMAATPINQYFDTVDKKCGIWYESKNPSAKFTSGKDNGEVMNCFTEAFDKCLNKTVLIVKDNYSANENNIIYAMLRIIKANDQNDCIVQNSYEEYSFSQPLENQIPINYLNTCTKLDETLEKSCRPAYLDSLDLLQNKTESSEIKIETN